MKKFLLLTLAFFAAVPALRADEGMWLLPFIQNNIKDMKAEGCRLSAEQIYSVNKLALKDAIVIFGNGCTGEIVSSEGLVLTNHHCGFGAIQQHSTVEHDYLKNGFWAMSRTEEIPTPGLTVTFVRSIRDVTDRILPELNASMSEKQRAMAVDSIGKKLTLPYQTSQYKKAIVQSMLGGNQYILFEYEVYPDVRLVGAPPSSIGKFGGDTDNWMWPRHTGDFSVFRVYSAPDGKPAAYAKGNVPYQAPTHLKISLKGMQPNDFAMIMGFPGSTQRYMTSWEIDRMLQVDNPIRIFIRGERQALLLEDMKADDRVRIQYASKYAQSSNYWKNSIGMSRGIEKLNVRAKKAAQEQTFSVWMKESPAREAQYGEAMPLIHSAVKESLVPKRTYQYLSEALVRGVELVGLTSPLRRFAGADSTQLNDKVVKELQQAAGEQYKDYNMPTDRKVAHRMVRIILDSLATADQPSFAAVIRERFNGNSDAYVDWIYDNSLFASQQKYEAFLAAPSVEKLRTDPGMEFALSVAGAFNQCMAAVARTNADFLRGQRLFIAGLQQMQPQHKFYPDANFTLRMTYGQVLPYRPADGVIYDYYTTLSGVIAKEDPNNAYEFTVPEKLKQLYAAKDFGPYAYKGDVPVAFLSNNDITGGNSGSPVMNGSGELIGLAFDGNWEAMSGDVAFEPALQRTISVDIRYVLFIIDKYAGAGHLLKEMSIVTK